MGWAIAAGITIIGAVIIFCSYWYERSYNVVISSELWHNIVKLKDVEVLYTEWQTNTGYSRVSGSAPGYAIRPLDEDASVTVKIDGKDWQTIQKIKDELC